MARIAGLGQSNMSLFSSKELEQEQRALLLKRLAFVIFCSDIDQHQKHMPDITGKNNLNNIFDQTKAQFTMTFVG